MPVIFAMSLQLVIDKSTFIVTSTILEEKLAIPILFALCPTTCVLLSFFEYFYTLTFRLSFFPFALVS